MHYQAPVKDMVLTLSEVAGLRALTESGIYTEATTDLLTAVLEEAGKLATGVIAPLNDRVEGHHATFCAPENTGSPSGGDGQKPGVTTPPGFREAYRQWVEGGWGSIAGTPDFGGQGLPLSLSAALQEIWNAASMSFGLCPILSQGAVEAITAHGTDAQKALYLEKLISGEWTGTMNLTEPQAGSDLSALQTRAVAQEDGTYRITGTKIYITYGEHDLVENIIHLVLARLPDAPAGTKGISLFIVPKFLVNPDGSPGARNDVRCTGIEDKLGIHGSPTCVMSYGENGGATGYLLGQENRGLNCMFTMMNNARLLVGIQGVAVAERAYQQALAYARERKQGRSVGTTLAAGEMVPIIQHVDVQRMLLTMKALTEAARALCYANAVALDTAAGAAGAQERAQGKARADLLTPIAKAWSTDIGVEVASLGVQVHGGMGFIEETGAARHYRDARIAPIYEGTNGIQSIDLVTRKLPLDNGGVVRAFLEEIRETVVQAHDCGDADLACAGEALAQGLAGLEEATDWMLARLAQEPGACLAGATPYQKLFGTVAGAHYLIRAALAPLTEKQGMRESKKDLACFFAEQILLPSRGLVHAATSGMATFEAGARSVLQS